MFDDEINEPDDEIYDSGTCPYCGSPESCEHLAAYIDKTFAECGGGELYERKKEFRALIEHSFLRMLKSDARPSFRQPDLAELWQAAKADYVVGSDEVYLDDAAFFRLLIDMLEESGGVGISVTEEGGPGMSSACWALYDDKPSELIARALSLLRRHLEPQDTKGQ